MARKARETSVMPVSSSLPAKAARASAPEPAAATVDSVAPVPLPAIPDEDLGLLCSDYDTDRLYAIPRDPEKVFATWELSSATRLRAAVGHLEIRFWFTDGRNTVEVTDIVGPGSHIYYCSVPDGMLMFSTEIGIVTAGRFDSVMSTLPMSLAVDFVRPGVPEFVRVDMHADISRGSVGGRFPMTAAAAPSSPQASVETDPVADSISQRNWIGYMPVSGRK